MTRKQMNCHESLLYGGDGSILGSVRDNLNYVQDQKLYSPRLRRDDDEEGRNNVVIIHFPLAHT